MSQAISKRFAIAAVAGAAALGGSVAAVNYAQHQQEEISQRIETHITTALNNVLELDGAVESGQTITVDGTVTVEPAGLNSYTVTLPKISSIYNDQGTALTAAINAPAYTLRLQNMAAALTGQAAEFVMTSTAPMTVDVRLQDDYSDEKIEGRADCAAPVITGTADEKAYKLNFDSGACALTGSGALDDSADFELQSGLNFVTTLSNDAQGQEHYDSLLTLNDLHMPLTSNGLYDPAGDRIASISMEKLQFRSTRHADTTADAPRPGYSGSDNIESTQGVIEFFENNASIGTLEFDRLYGGLSYDDIADFETLQQGLAAGDISVLPQSLGAQIGIEDIVFSLENLQEPITGAAAINVTLDDIRSDNAQLNVHKNLELKNVTTMLDRDGRVMVPDSASCDINATELPLNTLGENLGGMLANGHNLDPLMLSFALAGILYESDAQVSYDCAVAATDFYRGRLHGTHRIEGMSTPGEGALEVYGIEQITKQLSFFYGPELFMLRQYFTDMAHPTADGEGLEWKYEMDPTGNLKVNGQPLGPVLFP